MARPTPCRLALVLLMAAGTLVLGQSGSQTSIATHLKNLPPFRPVDEAPQDSSLAAVRKEALNAIRAKDAERLMSYFSDSFVFGGERRDDNWLRLKHWLVSGPADDWAHLDRALSHGGAFTTTRGAVEGRREF